MMSQGWLSRAAAPILPSCFSSRMVAFNAPHQSLPDTLECRWVLFLKSCACFPTVDSQRQLAVLS